jgi:hypothetical protein
MATRGFGGTRGLALAASSALICLAAGALPPSAVAAKAPKFAISVSGTDVQDWTVAKLATGCTRYGSGRQTVRFASKRTVVASISERRSPPGSEAGLFFTGPGAVRYTLAMDGKGTITRQDGTVYTPPDPGQPCDAAAATRDCGARALENVRNYRGQFLLDDPERFHLTLLNQHRHLVLQSLYWESEESAFANCLALKTPEGCCADQPPFWNGPNLGEQLYDGADAPMTPRIHPLTLRRGHTYRFRATGHYTLRVDPNVTINSPFGHGKFELMSSGIPRGDLGSPRSVTQTIAWVVTLRRVA